MPENWFPSCLFGFLSPLLQRDEVHQRIFIKIFGEQASEVFPHYYKINYAHYLMSGENIFLLNCLVHTFLFVHIIYYTEL